MVTMSNLPVRFRQNRSSGVLGALLWLATILQSAGIQAEEQPKIARDKLAGDPFAQLVAEVEAGSRTLAYQPGQGYLPALLEALEIPVESQLLLFSKTSLQARYISPRNPRALYFNDDINLGWIPDAPIIELMAQDPERGSVFYSIAQDPEKFVAREERRCDGCHKVQSARGTPGYLLRSFEVDRSGQPRSGRARITQATPIAERWGGWYISGSSPHQPHRGNLIGPEDQAANAADPSFRGSLASLSEMADLSRYPHAGSDVVAALVLDHLANTYNAMHRVGHDARNKDEYEVDSLVTALLGLDAAPVHGPIRGSTGYQTRFTSQGPRDAQGRTLRELDLQTRVFRWGLSPLVASRTYRGLPENARKRVEARLRALLSGTEPWPDDVKRDAEDHRVALELLDLATGAEQLP